jgi:hypothetical protein
MTILITILILGVMSVSLVSSQQMSWIITKRTGNWEKVEPQDFSTDMGPEKAELEFKASGIRLGYIRLTFNIDLQGTSGANITGKIIFRAEELEFEIRYIESFIPGIYGLNDKIANRLVIIHKNKVLTDTIEYANWPSDSRLNNRLYIWIWRSSDNTLTWIISDGYMQAGNNLGVFYNGSLNYNNEELTLTLTGMKEVTNGDGRLVAYLIYNELDASGAVFEEFQLSVLDYGFNSFFYFSISFFITVMTGHLLHRSLERELRIKAEALAKAKEKKKK